MSLLIDALKKHRLTSTPSTAQVGADALKSVASSKTKKIIFIALIALIVIVLTAITSFLIFKQIEKKRMAQMLGGKIEQVQTLKTRLEEKSSAIAAKPEATEGAGGLREKLKQRMQEQTENQSPVTTSSNDSVSSDSAPASASTSTAASTSDTDSSSSDSASTPSAASAPPRARLAAHRAGDVPAAHFKNDMDNNSQNNTDTTTTDDSQNSADTSVASNSDGNDNSGDNGVKVDIKVVDDELGANNATYQKALGYMQLNQYDKALPLLENNDDLLLKTQGLSALLLARIYLATAEYELADQVIDRALLLHAGSEIELLALRAQALFMLRKYQEAVDLLSSQSPDLSTSPEYYALLADAYMHLDQPENAASVFQQIVARFPNSPSYWLGLAVAYQKIGDATSAVVAYRRAAQLSADDPQVTLFINQQLSGLQAT